MIDTAAATPERFNDLGACCDELLRRTGKRVVLGLPLGIGKSNRLANALVERAERDPSMTLTIMTALTLEVPRGGNLLQRRFLSRLHDTLYADYEELRYAQLRRSGSLPDNVRVIEFYLQPGTLLGNRNAQQNYVSSNYSQISSDLLRRGVNVLIQTLAPHATSADQVSLSCNPDITAMLLRELDPKQRRRITLVGEMNAQLPYMFGDAELASAEFDLILDDSETGSCLFPVPNQPVSYADHAVGLLASTLIPDGGTLQVGIGNLGDTLVHALLLRQQHNDAYRSLLSAIGDGTDPQLAPSLEPFHSGLYGNSEMFIEGFLDLRAAGVLSRTPGVDGVWLHAGFFLGSARFYQRLRELSEVERRGIGMSAIDFTNTLRGNRAAKADARQSARFCNSAMMVTLTGAVVSDGLDNARVVSGVGGQYEFVSQAFELPDARSIIMLRATRTDSGRTASNIVWQYPHTTLPRHLRDIVVTEYGIADLRGKTDREVIIELLGIADSRFQEILRRQAIAAGKLESAYRLPAERCENYPTVLEHRLARQRDLLPHFPIGTDFDLNDALAAVALKDLKGLAGNYRRLLDSLMNGFRIRARQHDYREALAALDLFEPSTLRERFAAWLVLAALERVISAGRPLTRNSSEPGI